MSHHIANERYPDPAIHILDPVFLNYRVFSASVEQLYHGTRWGEGPVYFADGRYLLWSDIPNDRILRWDEATGQVGGQLTGRSTRLRGVPQRCDECHTSSAVGAQGPALP